MKSPGVRRIIFDLNGTLSDTRSVLVRTRHSLLRRLCGLLDTEEDELVAEFRAFLDGNSFHPDIIENLPAVHDWVREQHRVEPTPEVLARVMAAEVEAFRREVVEQTRLLPGARETLVELGDRGIRTDVWSGSRAPFVRDFVRLLGLDGLLHTAYCPSPKPGVVSSLDDIRLDRTRVVEFPHDAKKPDRDLLLRIVGDADIPEEVTLLVGNNPRSDGLSARNTGVRFVLTAWGNLDVEEEALLGYLTKKDGAAAPQPAPAPRCVEIAARLERSLAELVEVRGVGPDRAMEPNS